MKGRFLLGVEVESARSWMDKISLQYTPIRPSGGVEKWRNGRVGMKSFFSRGFGVDSDRHLQPLRSLVFALNLAHLNEAKKKYLFKLDALELIMTQYHGEISTFIKYLHIFKIF